MSALLDQAAKEARQGNLDLKKQVRNIENYFTNSVETSAQEAVLDSTNVAYKSNKLFLLTLQHQKKEHSYLSNHLFQKKCHQILQIQSDNDIKLYSKRPKSLDNWCLSDYISQLEIKYPNKLNQDLPGIDKDNSDNDEVQHNDTEDEDTNEKTADDNRDKINITLNNGITIKQRKSESYDMYDITDSEQYLRE